MALPALTFLHPGSSTFMRWGAVLTEALAGYNVPNPVSEDSWVDWAIQFSAVPDVVAKGPPDPRAFSDWRAWASYISQVLA